MPYRTWAHHPLATAARAAEGVFTMTVQDICNRMSSLSDGTQKPIYVWAWDENLKPDIAEQNYQNGTLLAVVRSDFVMNEYYKDELCNMEVERIYWTQDGIALMVE